MYIYIYIANRTLTWAGPSPWSLRFSPGLPWAAGPIQQSWSWAQAPGAGPGSCKHPAG